MAKKEVVKDVTSVEIEFADNGFVISYRGYTADDDWADAKIICKDLSEVGTLVQKIKSELG